MGHWYDAIKLPASLASLFQQADEEDVQARREARLRQIGKFFRDQLDKDIEARASSGIEAVWTVCEEAYAGIDDSNRHEFAGKNWVKPMTSDGPINTDRTHDDTGEVRSNAFERMTARYVDAAAAKVSDIMLPQNDEPFTFEPTPVPDLVNALEDERVVLGPDGKPLQRDATYAEAMALSGQQPPMNELAPATEPQSPVPMQPGQGPGVDLTVKDFAEERLATATKAADKAKQRILDWFIEAGYTRQMRMVNRDAARLGVGIMKGPIPEVQKSMAVTKVQDSETKEWHWEVKSVSKIVPTVKRVNPWDFYPAKDCGDDVKNGDHTFERALFTKAQLRALKEEPDYLADQIEAAIKEGPDKAYQDGANPSISEDDDRFRVWFRYGTISREDLEHIQGFVPKQEWRLPLPIPDKQDISAILTMVNDRVIRAVLNPSAMGAIPYHVSPWTPREGHWAGVGVAEQIMLPQRGSNGTLRALIDNTGLSAGVQVVIDTEAVEPSDGRWNLSRNKLWMKKPGASADDVRKAFMIVTVPSLQPQIQAVKDSFSRMAEDSTSIPLISQGQSGSTSPDTLGATQLQDNNANQLLRDKAHDFDQNIKLPLVTQFYEYLLLDPDVPNDEKGDYKIKISSSVALVEQAIHDQFIGQLFPMVQSAANPWRIDPAKLFKTVAKSKRLPASEIQYNDDEWKQITSQSPPKPPQVQVAEIKAQVDMARTKADTDRDTVYVQAETQRTQQEHEAKMAELASREKLAMLEYANRHRISLDELKAQLAQTTMKLQVQQQLAAQDRPGETTTPPTEPAGRAPNGQSFER